MSWRGSGAARSLVGVVLPVMPRRKGNSFLPAKTTLCHLFAKLKLAIWTRAHAREPCFFLLLLVPMVQRIMTETHATSMTPSIMIENCGAVSGETSWFCCQVIIVLSLVGFGWAV